MMPRLVADIEVVELRRQAGTGQTPTGWRELEGMLMCGRGCWVCVRMSGCAALDSWGQASPRPISRAGSLEQADAASDFDRRCVLKRYGVV